MGEGEGENDLCGVICGRGVTPFSARFAPDPRAEDDGGDTGETEPEGDEKRAPAEHPSFRCIPLW